jgi:hypothetical protein
LPYGGLETKKRRGTIHESGGAPEKFGLDEKSGAEKIMPFMEIRKRNSMG